VYATLDRLEEKGLVRSRDGEATPVRGGRARRHFELTTDGAGALARARAMMDRLWDGVDLERQGRGA
jgi:DNA-binding PadR family transcriptional regulator